jgi:hypothetical protein
MHRAGDQAKAPEGSSMMIRNILVRPGRYEKRPAFVHGGALPAGSNPSGIYKYHDDEQEILVYTNRSSSGSTPGGYRHPDTGVWTALGSDVAQGYKDAVALFGILYGLNEPDSTGDGFSFSVDSDGMTTSADPFNLPITGNSICAAANRLFIAAPTITVENQLGAKGVEFEHVDWGKANVTITAIGSPDYVRRLQFTAAVANTSTFLTRATAGPVTWQASFRNNMDVTVPITINITNGGSTVYASKQILLAARSISGYQWEDHTVTAEVPAGIYWLDLKNGTTAITGVNGAIIDVAMNPGDLDDPELCRGSLVTETYFNFELMPPYLSVPGATETHGSRILFCEVDDVTRWYAYYFVDAADVPGDLNLIRSAKGRVYAFKDSAIYLYMLTDQEGVLEFEDRLDGFG